MQRAIEAFHRAEEGFLALLLAAMTLVTFVQVILRYVFASGFIWALELVTFLFGWLVIMGVGYGIRVHSHIGVDAVVRLLPSPAQRVLSLLAVAAGLAYCGMMVYGGWIQVDILALIGMETEDLKIPQWIPYSALVLGFGLACWRLLVAAWKIVTYRETTLIGSESEDALKQFAKAGKANGEAGK